MDDERADVFAVRPRLSTRAVTRIAVIGAVIVLVLVAVWIQVAANREFDAAAMDFDHAQSDARDAAELLAEAADDGADKAAASGLISAAAADDLVDVGARTGLVDAAAVLQSAVETADGLLEADEPSLPAKPFWPWELYGAASAVEEMTAGVTELSADMHAAGGVIEESDAALLTSAQALYASVAPAAALLEAAHVSARNIVVLDFRDASEAAAQQTMVGSGAATAFATYAERAANLKASAQSELAEKAGPLMRTRLEIEAFARSIAGGVVLDFDWAPIVNGLGGSAGMAGTATWNTVRGGFSTITLSDSVAENWPSVDARALVAHEVGHAITSKCSDRFDSSSGPANEQWATAWAISMGYTSLGSGIQAYGYPPADMIEKAATCR